MDILSQIFSSIIDVCYSLLGNYGLAIIVFTLLTKIILLPVSLWTQRNSIKMVEMMPDLNRLKINLLFYLNKYSISVLRASFRRLIYAEIVDFLFVENLQMHFYPSPRKK